MALLSNGKLGLQKSLRSSFGSVTSSSSSSTTAATSAYPLNSTSARVGGLASVRPETESRKLMAAFGSTVDCKMIDFDDELPDGTGIAPKRLVDISASGDDAEMSTTKEVEVKSIDILVLYH